MTRLTLLIFAALVALSIGCGSSGNSDKKAIESLIRQQYAAANARDWSAFSALFTESGLKQQVPDANDDSPAARRQAWLSRTHHYDLRSVSDITATGSEGTATGITVADAGGEGNPAMRMVYATRNRVVKVGDAWKIDHADFVSPPLPEGVRVVPITATEFSYDVDTSAMEDGNFAIQFHNNGKQTHQIHLVRIAPDLDIEGYLRGQASSLENVDIGSTPLIAPGDSMNVPFSGPLEKGRYVMYCSLPDTDDPARTPHSLKGQVKEFTVQ